MTKEMDKREWSRARDHVLQDHGWIKGPGDYTGIREFTNPQHPDVVVRTWASTDQWIIIRNPWEDDQATIADGQGIAGLTAAIRRLS